MSMFFVTDPDGVVANIQSLLDTPEDEHMKKKEAPQPIPHVPRKIQYEIGVKEHTIDTRSKIRDVLR
jgi:hypothetical protein